MPSQNEIREKVTKTIIEALEKGGLPPWRKPWRNDSNAGFPTNIVSGKKYRGINPLLLQVASMRHNLQSKYWGTFRQWKELGGCVKKRPSDVPSGEWGTQIIYYSPISKRKRDDDGNESEDRFFILKSYTVFCIDQVEGDHLDHLRAGNGDNESQAPDLEDYLETERIIAATGADIREAGNDAYYRKDLDYIQVPSRSQCDATDFYEILFHELVHWAVEKSNPALSWGGSRTENELIAEIGACFLCSEVGVPMSDDLTNHASYVKSWLKSMNNDPKYIFTAAAQAAKAVDYILSFSRMPEPVCAE